jgi:flagellar protein FlbD
MGMIRLTRLNGSEYYLNPALIEMIEETPDTHITLSNGNRYLSLESAKSIIEQMIMLQTRIMRRASSSETRKYLVRKNVQNYQTLSRAETD